MSRSVLIGINIEEGIDLAALTKVLKDVLVGKLKSLNLDDTHLTVKDFAHREEATLAAQASAATAPISITLTVERMHVPTGVDASPSTGTSFLDAKGLLHGGPTPFTLS